MKKHYFTTTYDKGTHEIVSLLFRCYSGPCRSKLDLKPVRSGVLCNQVDDCSVPGVSGEVWEYPPGYPQDECSAKCPKTSSMFLCTNDILYGWTTFNSLLTVFCEVRSIMNVVFMV